MTTTSLTIWPKIGSGCNTLTNHTYPHTTSPHFFFGSLRLSQYIAWYAVCLPTCKRIYPDLTWSKNFLLNWGKGMIQWNSLLPNGLTSLFLFPQSILLPAACRYQARRLSRSGQPSFRRMYNTCAYYLLLPLPFAPLEKIHTTQRTREGDLDLGSWCFGILPVCLSCPPVRPAAMITAEYESCSRLCICI